MRFWNHTAATAMTGTTASTISASRASSMNIAAAVMRMYPPLQIKSFSPHATVSPRRGMSLVMRAMMYPTGVWS